MKLYITAKDTKARVTRYSEKYELGLTEEVQFTLELALYFIYPPC
jgi:hypothetical protein